MTVLLAYLAGFFAGNGLPYYYLGSTGQTHPTPFGKSATVNVAVGCVAFVIAMLCWHFAHARDLSGYAAAMAGVLTVGIIHARGWHNNPWAGRYSENDS